MLYLSGALRRELPGMITPHMGQRPFEGQIWAGDSGRYNRPDLHTDEGYLAWLATMPRENCLFVTAPDVVGDATSTLLMSAPMYWPIRNLGFPVALVAQDGLERLRECIPWDDFDCLFIGGTTHWKLSDDAAALVAEAKARGKWTHMGRVNSRGRLLYADAIGCDSADGTYIAFGGDKNAAKVVAWLAQLHEQNAMLDA